MACSCANQEPEGRQSTKGSSLPPERCREVAMALGIQGLDVEWARSPGDLFIPHGVVWRALLPKAQVKDISENLMLVGDREGRPSFSS